VTSRHEQSYQTSSSSSSSSSSWMPVPFVIVFGGIIFILCAFFAAYTSQGYVFRLFVFVSSRSDVGVDLSRTKLHCRPLGRCDSPWCTRMCLVVRLNRPFRVKQVGLWFPCVMLRSVTFPFDQVLQTTSSHPRVNDLFNIVLQFAFDLDRFGWDFLLIRDGRGIVWM